MSLLLLQPNRVVAASAGAAPAWEPNRPAATPTLVSDLSWDEYTWPNGVSLVNGWQMSPSSGDVLMSDVPTPMYQRLADDSGGFGPNIGRINYRQNSPHGNGDITQSTATGSVSFSHITMPKNVVREWYWILRFRLSANYEVHTNQWTEKFWYPTVTPGEQCGLIQLGRSAAIIEGKRTFTMGVYTYPAGSLVIVPLANPITFGDWHTIEVHQRIETFVPGGPNLSDGFVRVWIDGALDTDIQNTRLGSVHATQQLHWEFARLNSTRGGGNSSILTPPEGMWREYDRMALYRRVEP